MSRPWSAFLVLALLAVGVPAGDADAQGRGRGGGPPQAGRTAAPRDLTGSWVSVVSEHWHLRMTMPPSGDFAMLPLNAEARTIAAAWDPAADEAQGLECRAYGAAAIMRVPSRLEIQWVDDNTLRMNVDSGTQTRLFRFNASPPPNQAAEWQGYSVAEWVNLGGARSAPSQLKVTTTHMRPGLLRKNGVPYSGDAVLEEYYDYFMEPNGDEWLVVMSILTDPQYLTRPYATTAHFRKIPDGSGWDPTPCSVDRVR